MKLPESSIQAQFSRRYKRFLADFQTGDGSILTAHCANTGSMLGLLQPGAPALLSHATDPRRRLSYTWELVHEHQSWVGIHTGRANAIVREYLAQGMPPALGGYNRIQAEVTLAELSETGSHARGSSSKGSPSHHSRLDFRLDGENRPPCFLEVKSVTLRQGDEALFPDAVTNRGRQHLEDLARLNQMGYRSVILFLVQREDCQRFRPASHIDPAYAATLRRVVEAGVEIMAFRCKVGLEAIRLDQAIPWDLG
ncbi:MAG: DNA/RNA nuclease SfsA [Magnetococcales bacterium]|nr:DNA/RNA nuclease SfsA [Magnetococcales bacterium]